jgi:hypothetical protein
MPHPSSWGSPAYDAGRPQDLTFEKPGRVVVTGPNRGKNAGGDSFRTDGEACVVEIL